MGVKQTEALKLALEKAFDLGKRYWSWADSEYSSHWKKADAAKEQFNQLVEDTIREALAEQPAQQSASVLEQNTSNSLETTNQEAQDEPVAWMFQHEETGRTMCVDAQQVEWGFEKGNPRLKKIAPLYTSPPASKPWVGLTPKEKKEIERLSVYVEGAIRHTEAKLKEKNAQPSKPWVGLTDDEMRDLEKQFNAERVRTSDEEYLVIYPGDYWAWQRAIEAKLKEKNAQPSKPWVGLTQQDIDIAFDDTQEGGGFDEFARAIEAKLREKNTPQQSKGDA